MKVFLLTFLFSVWAVGATVAITGSLSKANYSGAPSSAVWASLASGDNGAAVEAGHAINMAVQFSGTFTATTVVLEGSNDGVTYYTMDDVEDAAISKTSAAAVTVRDRFRYVRPRISAGGASTDVTATLFISKPN